MLTAVGFIAVVATIVLSVADVGGWNAGTVTTLELMLAETFALCKENVCDL